MSSAVVRWPALLAATGTVLPWGPVLAAGGAGLATAGAMAVVPPGGDGLLLVLGVLVLVTGVAVAGEDPSAAVAEVAPVGPRRRLAARLLLVLPVSAAALAGVWVLAVLAGAAPGRGPVLLWVSLAAVATAVGAAAARSAAAVPGPPAAAAVLGAGLLAVPLLPASVTGLPPWDSAAERVAWALAVSTLVLARATRDRAA
ncbi:hypothetical protein ACI78R_02740 [Geodermatophilus sp. SYSU D01106]